MKTTLAAACATLLIPHVLGAPTVYTRGHAVVREHHESLELHARDHEAWKRGQNWRNGGDETDGTRVTDVGTDGTRVTRRNRDLAGGGDDPVVGTDGTRVTRRDRDLAGAGDDPVVGTDGTRVTK